jgi:hypothetical protein
MKTTRLLDASLLDASLLDASLLATSAFLGACDDDDPTEPTSTATVRVVNLPASASMSASTARSARAPRTSRSAPARSASPSIPPRAAHRRCQAGVVHAVSSVARDGGTGGAERSRPSTRGSIMTDHREPRHENDADLPQRDAGGRRRASGPLISGRSFAGAKIASDERREQTADHRGESQRHRLDDGGARVDPASERPADES